MFEPLGVGGGGLGATYDDYLRLIRKRVVDFLLVLIELFSLGVTAEALRANSGSKSAISRQRGPVDPKFQKTRLNDLSYGIKKTGQIFLPFCHKHAFDRRTDRYNSHH